MQRIRTAHIVSGTGRWPDLVFLAAVVMVSVAPYVAHLGFYGDDWTFLGTVTNATNHSVATLVREQLAFDPDGPARLTNIVYQTVLFRVFALNPLGYHVVNAVVLLAIAVFAYVTLRELGAHRTIALSIAAVYILLPNYSTDRFWIIAFAYDLSMASTLVGTYALLRALRSRRFIRWIAGAVLVLTVAALGFEVVIPLMLAIPVAVWWRSRRLGLGNLRDQLRIPQCLLSLATPLVVILATAVYKANTARGITAPSLGHLERLVAGALAVNFGTYGIALPHTVAWSLRQLPWSDLALAILLGGIVLFYVSKTEIPFESRRPWITLVLLGCVVFGLGTAIFVTTTRIAFWSTGLANRVWIAAALGVALIFVGGFGWVTAWLPSRLRRPAYAALIASLCVSGFVVTTALARYWIIASSTQLEVLRDIQRALPTLPTGTTLILGGVCPYVGPALVFESSWDLAGALRVVYRDPRLWADVATGRFSVHENGLRTEIYETSAFYPYSTDLLLFDRRRGTVTPLIDHTVAQAYLTERMECPDGAAGGGAVALPIDSWYAKIWWR
jgi:hypothetical protein